MKLVKYLRYSTEMQRPESCDDQERKINEALMRLGISTRGSETIKDEASSGTKESRRGFSQLKTRIAAGEPLLIVVDDQSRFSRGDNVKGLIKDIVYAGGRFISIGERIDTNIEGWELLVGINEIHNSLTISDLGRRVRRGQQGRILDGNGSAGDLCYGYSSKHVEPNWQAQSNRGPKPKKIVVINNTEAKVVKKVFTWFIAKKSISAIGRKLTTELVSKGKKSSKPNSPWHHHQVRRMLGNKKYIGIWTWGKTRTIRDSRGCTKQIPVNEDEIEVRCRPDLRIINNDMWHKTQHQLELLKSSYGVKKGQKPRGPKPHYIEKYPKNMLSGLLTCSVCGSRLIVQSGGKENFYGCPNHRAGVCTQVVRVPQDRGQTFILDAVINLLLQSPEWLIDTRKKMKLKLSELATTYPEELANKLKQKEKTENAVTRLVDAISEGLCSDAIKDRLQGAEELLISLSNEIEKLEKAMSQNNLKLPTDIWIKKQLSNLAELIKDRTQNAALLLRQLLGNVVVEEVKLPGKKRGYPRLHITVQPNNVLNTIIPENIPKTIINELDDKNVKSITIDLGEPTRMDKWLPKIIEMRKQDVPWRKIGKITGLGRGNAYIAWKRWFDRKEVGELT